MSKLPWTPWHKIVQLRDDLRSGELSLAVFAADLYDVAMQQGQRPIYEDPAQFFALTYPTYNLRELAKDVVLRLAGQNDKAVRQLELTYGGGKTHSLITLYHLVNDPARLPALPAVQEFIQHIGLTPPPARVAVLPFDKLDVEKGMEVRGPGGELRWLKHPWSVLAFQLAGADGLRLLHADNLDAERASAPAENLLRSLLAMPQTHPRPSGRPEGGRGEGLSTLVLIDEVLMFAREKIGLSPEWRARLVDFFQYLTQAVTKVDRCALVASLLATDPRKSDQLGKELTQELYAIFRREKEEGVQPVMKEDVAEVLRRRFFTPGSIQNREAFRPHVVAALKGVAALDEQTAKAGQPVEERYLASYPFHPDLTEIFYTKWTNLEGFQRTRGVLRTFALALRDAEKWDTCPLIGVNVFLGAPGDAAGAGGISEAARELTNIAETEEYEGKRQEWSAILLGELEKARAIQHDYPGLAHRELEQAVLATFLHSQPIGQKALTRELLLLLGHTRADRIELEKAMRRWTDISWFLDEDVMETGAGTEEGLPAAWRLGSRPNLTQMHDDACKYRVPPELVQARLIEEIQGLKSLTLGAKGPGARVHVLPQSPDQVADDGDFHYVILPPEAACDAGKPSDLARRFLDETTGPGKPRVYRNALVLAAPSSVGLEQVRQGIVNYLAWEEVRAQLQPQHLDKTDPLRWSMLIARLDATKKAIPSAIRQAYSIVVAVSEANEVEAFKITVGSDSLFTTIKNDPRARIQETAISAEALLPGGPYELWRGDETTRWLKDLVGAFAQHPHLPKMLNAQAILDTLIHGCVDGLFVFRFKRPDGSIRTFWRCRPEDAILKEPALEVVLPEAAELTSLSPSLLAPDVLPELWQASEVTVQAVYGYFAGGNVVHVQKGGYEEPVSIPSAPVEVVNAAIEEAVEKGQLWLLSGPASIWSESIPAGLLSPDVRLLPPPKPVALGEILPPNLPEAWQTGTTTALAIGVALSKRAGENLPWRLVRNAIEAALKANYLERTLDSGPWPCEYPGAQNVKLRTPGEAPPPPPLPKPGVRFGEARLKTNELQDLGDAMEELGKAAAGYDLRLHVRVELGGDPPEAVMDKVNEVLGEVSEALRVK